MEEKLAKMNGFKNQYEREKFMNDPNFMEIYEFGNYSENNPYILWLRWLEKKDEKAREKVIESLPRNMDISEKIKYIGKLARGLEILKESGKI